MSSEAPVPPPRKKGKFSLKMKEKTKSCNKMSLFSIGGVECKSTEATKPTHTNDTGSSFNVNNSDKKLKSTLVSHMQTSGQPLSQLNNASG